MTDKNNYEIIQKPDPTWKTQEDMCDIYDKDQSVISKHIKNILENEEINSNSTHALYASVRFEGGREVTRQIEYYSPEIVARVGFRVNSGKGAELQKVSDERTIKDIQKIGDGLQNKQESTQLVGEITQLKNEVISLKEAIIDITTTYRIDEEEKYFLNQLAKERIVELFKFPYNEIDKTKYRIAIAALWRDFKERFKISKYAMLPRMELKQAKEYIRYWNNIPYDRFKK